MKRYISFALFALAVFCFTQCQNDKTLLDPATPQGLGKKGLSTSITSTNQLNVVVAPPVSYRGVYLDKLTTIVGTATKEDSLLAWCKKYNFTTITCYGLYTLLSERAYFAKMAAFIKKARTKYGIKTVAASMGSAAAFTTAMNSSTKTSINEYNNSRTDTLERFNQANLELEWWNGESTYPNFLNQLSAIQTWGKSQNPKIPTEEYIGWFKNPAGQDSLQAAGLVKYSDRILIHDYYPSPSYGYIENRLKTIAKAAKAQNKVIPIIIIFSAEMDASGNYFITSTFEQAYNTVIAQYNTANFVGKEFLKPIGYQIFAQSDARLVRP